MHLQQSRYQQAELAQRGQQNQAENQLRQQQLEQAQKNIDSETDYRKGMLTAEHDRLQAEHDKNSLMAKQFVQAMVEHGTDPTKVFQPGKAAGTIHIPGVDEDIDPTGYRTAQQAADFDIANKVKETSQTTTAKLQAEEPFNETKRQADFTNQWNLDRAAAQERFTQMEQQGINTAKLRQAEDDASMARTRLEVNGHLAGARIAATGVNDPNDVQTLLGQGKQLADGVAVGTLDPTKLTKQRKIHLIFISKQLGT